MYRIRLEELRDELGYSKKSIALQLKVSSSMYGRWENSKADISTKRIIQLANFFEINIDYLLGLTNTKRHVTYIEEIDINMVAERIKEVRKDYKESLRNFSKRLNTSNSTWSAYEQGKVLILGSFLLEICKMGNYSAEWILGKSNIKYLI